MQKPGLVVFLAIVYNGCKLSDPKPSLSPPVVIPLRFFDPPETLVLVIMSWVTATWHASRKRGLWGRCRSSWASTRVGSVLAGPKPHSKGMLAFQA